MIIEIHPQNDNKENNTNINVPKSQNREQQSDENTKLEKSTQNNIRNDTQQRKKIKFKRQINISRK